MNSIAIIGASGFVGRNMVRYFRSRKWHVQEGIGADMPPIVLNCAGYKDLNGCEADPKRAMDANAFLPAKLAKDCREHGSKLVHISSDHVYGLPPTKYSQSKARGDEMALQYDPDALIVVSGHIYAQDCPWVCWLDDCLRARRPVDAWTDAYNYPTYCDDLGHVIEKLISENAKGRVVAVGDMQVNRRELFQMYAEAFGYDPSLIRTSPTPRPPLIPSRIVFPLGLVRRRCPGPAIGFARMREAGMMV